MSESSSRTRNYATLVYPDSAPEGWLNILNEVCIEAFVSPLHDMDINPDGEPKKPHYHVMIMFEGPKTKKQAKEVFDKIGGVGCIVVQSKRGYARYLLHLDNPEKYPYKSRKDEIICFCGADYEEAITLVTDVYECIREIMFFIEDNNIDSLRQLSLWCAMNNESWHRVITTKATVFFKAYFSSRVWEKHKYHRKALTLDEIQEFSVEKQAIDVNTEETL